MAEASRWYDARQSGLGLQGALGADASVASPEYVATLRARLVLQLRGLGPAERTSKPAHPRRAGRRPRTKGAA